MIVDGDRRVVRQMGSRPVAVDTLDKLSPAGSTLDAAFAKSGTDKAEKPPRPNAAVPARRRSEACDARNRRGKLPRVCSRVPSAAGSDGLRAGAKAESSSPRLPVGEATLDGHATVTSAKPTPADPPGATAPPQTCFLVGLMPNHSLMRSALTLSPLPLVTLGFIAAIALALLPTARLLLIGTGDALPGYAAAGVVLGIPLAAGFATLALLFATDVVRERAGARRGGGGHRGDGDVGPDRLDGGDRRSRRRRHHAQTDRELDPGENEEPAIDPDPKVPIDPDPKPVAPKISRPCPLSKPLLPSMRAVDLGCRARTLQFRHKAPPWNNVGSRDYFIRARDGESDGVSPASAMSWLSPLATDGINKTVVALPRADFGGAKAPPKPADPCAAAVVVASTVLPSLLAPILPEPLGFIVVDSRALDGQPFPVLFHDQPEHAGARISGPNSTRRDLPCCANGCRRRPLRRPRHRHTSRPSRPRCSPDATRGRLAASSPRGSPGHRGSFSSTTRSTTSILSRRRPPRAPRGVAGDWLSPRRLRGCSSSGPGGGARPAEPLATRAGDADVASPAAGGDRQRELSAPRPRRRRGGDHDALHRRRQAASRTWSCSRSSAGAAFLVAAIAHPALGIGRRDDRGRAYVPCRMRLGGPRPITALTPRTQRRYRWMIVAFIICAIGIPVDGFW